MIPATASKTQNKASDQRERRSPPRAVARTGIQRPNVGAGFSRRISGRYDSRDSVQNTEQSKRPTGAAIPAPAPPPTARHRLSDCEPSFYRKGEKAIAVIFVLFLPGVDFRRESDLEAVADGVEVV